MTYQNMLVLLVLYHAQFLSPEIDILGTYTRDLMSVFKVILGLVHLSQNAHNSKTPGCRAKQTEVREVWTTCSCYMG